MRAALTAIALLLLACAAHATNVNVIGLFPGKAVLVVNGGSPKTYSVGKAISDGLKLIAVDESSATLEENGKRFSVRLGEHLNASTSSGATSVTLQADSGGHFMTQGQINGGMIRFLVDTGATAIALSASDASRLGINYKKGRVGYMNTANGPVAVYWVTLDTVRIGDVELSHVDATVHESGLPFALLGMTFLKRTEMRRSGEQMTLTKLY